MSRFVWSIWTINALLQWGLFILVLRKSNWREHPAFAIYVAFCSSKTSLLMWVRLFAFPFYVSVNWGARIVTLPLLIAVLVEVFAAVFRPYSTLPNGTLRWFRTVVTALIFITAVAALCFPGHAPGDWKNTVMVLDRSASIIFCGAFGFTALFSSYFGIPWQHRTYGIGVGFLLFMSVDIFKTSLSATYGVGIAAALNAVSMLGYMLALITWIIYFAAPDVPSRIPTLEQLKRLQKALDYTAVKAESYGELV
jgi:hypothetical protein